jgi:diacylglycerol kinase family enzyme
MPPRRLLIIHNAAAGRQHRRTLEAFRQALNRCGSSWSMIEVETLQQAERAAGTIDPTKFDAVVAAGGDGTITHIINGLVAAESPLPLAILPLGTANVLARELGLPRDPVDAGRLAAFGATRAVRPGMALFGGEERRLFMLMLGVGIDAAVVAGVKPLLKRLFGRLSFGVSIAVRLATFQPGAIHVTIDGKRFPVASVIVSRARHYAGDYILAPTAALDGPDLIAILLLRSGFLAWVGYGWDLIRGTLAANRDVQVHAADQITIEGALDGAVQMDGDTIGSLPVTVSVAAPSVEIIANFTQPILPRNAEEERSISA